MAISNNITWKDW